MRIAAIVVGVALLEPKYEIESVSTKDEARMFALLFATRRPWISRTSPQNDESPGFPGLSWSSGGGT
jgi:hypothetical protein